MHVYKKLAHKNGNRNRCSTMLGTMSILKLFKTGTSSFLVRPRKFGKVNTFLCTQDCEGFLLTVVNEFSTEQKFTNFIIRWNSYPLLFLDFGNELPYGFAPFLNKVEVNLLLTIAQFILQNFIENRVIFYSYCI